MMLKAAAAVLLSVGVGTVGIYYYKPHYVILANARYQYFRTGLKQQRVTIGGENNSSGLSDNVPGSNKPITLRYLRRSPRGGKTDGVPFLFVHGFNSTADVWIEIIKKIPAEHEVIAVNLPAHAGSECDPTADLTFPGLAHRLRQFVEAVGLSDRLLHVIGQSMGGTLVVLYAASFPNVDRATIIAPGMHTPEPSDLFIREESTLRTQILAPGFNPLDLPPLPLIPSTSQQMEETIALCTNHPSGLSKQILQGIIELKKPNIHNMKILFSSIVRDMWESDEDIVKKYAPQIRAPTQLVWGEEDKVCHISGLDYLASLLPNCQAMVRLPDTGHSVNLVQPHTVATELVAFHSTQDATPQSYQLA